MLQEKTQIKLSLNPANKVPNCQIPWGIPVLFAHLRQPFSKQAAVISTVSKQNPVKTIACIGQRNYKNHMKKNCELRVNTPPHCVT